MAWKGPQGEVVPVTAELAQRFSAMSAVPGERSINRQRLAFLRGEIEAGRVISFLWVSAICNGIEYRINGQHTSHLFCSGVEPIGTATIHMYECDTLEDVVRLWSKFDNHKSVRLKNEKIKAVAEADGRLSGVKSRVTALASSAASIRCYGAGYANKVSDERKFDALLEYVNFALWAKTLFPTSAGSSNGFTLRVGVWFAALCTWEQGEQKATEFWNHVLNADSSNPKCPTRVLREALLTHSVDTGQGSRCGKKTLKWDQVADMCLSAWNLWKEGREVSFIRLHRDGLSAVAPPAKYPQGQVDE